MAQVGNNPVADWLVPDPELQLNWQDDSFYFGQCVGLFAFTEGGTRSPVSVGSTSYRGLHMIAVWDVINGVNSGRWGTLWTQGAVSDLTANAFNVNTVLTGIANTALPDFAGLNGFVLIGDSVGRRPSSPDGCVMTSGANFTALPSGEATTVIAALEFDASASVNAFTLIFSDIVSAPAWVPFASAAGGPAVGDIVHIGFLTPNAGVTLQFTQAATGIWTGQWEYFNGTTWVALSGVSDATNGLAPGTSGIKVLSYTRPDTWQPTSPVSDAPELFYIRYVIATFTSGASSNVQVSNTTAEEAIYFDRHATALNEGTSLASGDFTLFGFKDTIGRIRLNCDAVTKPTATANYEFWNGTAWTVLSGVSDDTDELSLTDLRTLGFSAPVGWAKLRLSVDEAHNLFWMRIRWSGVSVSYSATPKSPFVVGRRISEVARGSAAMFVGEDPGTDAPKIMEWGVPLPDGVVASALGLFTYWDPVNELHSKRFVLNDDEYIAAHDDPNVTKIARWTDATEAATLAATNAHGSIYDASGGAFNTEDPRSDDPTIVIGVDGGGPVVGDETLTGSDRDEGAFRYVTTLRRRLYFGGAPGEGHENEIGWTERNDPHTSRNSSRLQIAKSDGDFITGMEAHGDQVLIFKTERAYRLAGEPDAGQQIIQVSKGIGCIAPRTLQIAGEELMFLGRGGLFRVDAGGRFDTSPLSQPVDPLIRNLTQPNLAVGAYDAKRRMYYLAAAGLQAQVIGGAGPGQVLNDGILSYHLDTGQWALWIGAGCFAASLAPALEADGDTTVWSGDYWGRLHRLSDADAVDGQRVSGNTYSGTATGGSLSTLEDSGATWSETSAYSVSEDRRMIGQEVWILRGTGAGQKRHIVDIDGGTPELQVSPDWSIAPDNTSVYVIGAIYWKIDFADWALGDPRMRKALRDVWVHLADDLAAGNTIDIGVDPDGRLDDDAAVSYASSTVKQDIPLLGPYVSGRKLQLRVHGQQGHPTTRPIVHGITITPKFIGGTTFA